MMAPEVPATVDKTKEKTAPLPPTSRHPSGLSFSDGFQFGLGFAVAMMIFGIFVFLFWLVVIVFLGGVIFHH
jgi:hypothetical protein